MSLAHAFSNNLFFVAIFLFLILSWPRRRGRLRGLVGLFSSRTPLAARQLEGAAFYRNYLFNGK